jgi:SAM-dependent methyltransferase
LRGALVEWLDERRLIEAKASGITRFGAISDETSLKVASQYEASPYPRWTSVPLFRPGYYVRHLATHFEPGRLRFTERPFEVLIAGCGTGRQAVSAAFDYGSNARVLGIDIAQASLGYAAMMAERMKAPNVTFARGDIRAIETFQPSFAKRFAVIECTGVLHHMADPFGAWRGLIECLGPGGIMLIGLYSRMARRNLPLLRQEAAYPGAACSEAELRTYRNYLKGRPANAPGRELMRGRDFYSASGFRDYFLHVSEKTTTLPEIRDFLTASGLTFRGFAGMPFEALKAQFPSEKPPGSLDRWAELEERHPDMFGAMYQFWCTAD